MAESRSEFVRLKDDYYRDGLNKVIWALFIFLSAIFLLMAVSLYLFFTKPPPVYFMTDKEWRVVPPIPVNKPYLTTPNLLQWVSEVLPSLFTNDFLSYKKRIDRSLFYFTGNGRKKYTEALNVYLNAETMQKEKVFLNAVPSGAPIVLNQGLLEGVYGWWVQMPLTLNYVTVNRTYEDEVRVQALVLRVPTLDNLEGVAIDNMIITKV